MEAELRKQDSREKLLPNGEEAKHPETYIQLVIKHYNLLLNFSFFGFFIFKHFFQNVCLITKALSKRSRALGRVTVNLCSLHALSS